MLLFDAGLPSVTWTETLAPIGASLLHGAHVDVRLLPVQAVRCSGSESQWAGARDRLAAITNPWGNAWHLRRPHFDHALKAEAERLGVCVLRARLTGLSRTAQGFHAHAAGSDVTCRRFIDATGASARAARLLGVQRDIFDRQVALAVTVATEHDSALAVATLEHGWCYRAPAAEGSVDVVTITDQPALQERGLSALLADAFAALGVAGVPSQPARRRAVLWQALGGALPENFRAVGDAAWTADPLSGQGLSLAVASALGAAGNREASARPTLREHIRARAALYASSRYASAAYYQRRLNAGRIAQELAHEN